MAFSDLDTAAQLSYALQVSLGVVFVLAAVPKLREPATFTRTVAAYRLLPRSATRGFAALVIAAESFLAFAFLTGWATSIALPLAALVVALFAVAVAVNLRRGQQVPCGCFGGESENISGRSLARLATLLGAVLLLALVRPDVTVATLAEDSVSALRDLVLVGAVAAVLVLGAAWLLNLRELGFVLRRTVGRGRA